MNFTKLVRNLGGISFAFALITGFLMLSGTSAQAQYRNDDRWERQRERTERRENRQERREDRRDDRWNDRNNNNVYRLAQQQGYNDGLREGIEDVRSRDRYNPQGSREYRRATNGWNGHYGNQAAFKQAYRNAFLQGYREGYSRYRYNNRF